MIDKDLEQYLQQLAYDIAKDSYTTEEYERVIYTALLTAFTAGFDYGKQY